MSYHLNGYKVACEYPISKEYEAKIVEAAHTIVYRAQCANIRCEKSDILIYYDSESKIWYILGNPILYTQPILDDDGNITEEIPIYNINLEYPTIKDVKVTRSGKSLNYKVTCIFPRAQIRIPDLCIRIRDDTT